jgi:ABC-2 type transport system ATP-binding protein
MVVEVRNLTKKFKGIVAVNDVSFAMREGEIVGLLGPNGAGKTTTIHMLLALTTPTSGSIHIFGKDLTHHREEILQDMNFASPYVSLPYRMTVFENLMVFATLYNVPRPRRRIEEILELLNISALKKEPIAALSSGQNTSVGLAKALLNKPRLLLLDEPTASLDPEVAHGAREILLRMRDEERTTILYTSHNMIEIERMCDRIIFLHHGRVIATGSPVEITKAILKEERNEPSLEEVFFRVVKDPHGTP